MDPRNYRPPRWLRNPHVQSVLSSSGLRRLLARKRRQLVESTAESHLLECSDGVLLQGFLTRQTTQAQSSGLVVLLHGWEGSARSNYVLHTAARLLQSGFDVFRLNFRDHGDNHHLNPDLFSSNKLGEVVDAVSEVARRFEPRWMGVVGYSLGGNFALRVGLQSRSAHLPLQHVIAICPVVSPPAGLQAIGGPAGDRRLAVVLRVLLHAQMDAVLAAQAGALSGSIPFQQGRVQQRHSRIDPCAGGAPHTPAKP